MGGGGERTYTAPGQPAPDVEQLNVHSGPAAHYLPVARP